MMSDQSVARVIIMARQIERRSHHIGSTRRWVLAIGVVALLLLPMIAMGFTDAVDWNAFDFAAAALLLGGGAIAYDMATHRLRSTKARGIATAAVILFVALVWAEGAVGVF